MSLGNSLRGKKDGEVALAEQMAMAVKKQETKEAVLVRMKLCKYLLNSYV